MTNVLNQSHQRISFPRNKTERNFISFHFSLSEKFVEQNTLKTNKTNRMKTISTNEMNSTKNKNKTETETRTLT